MVTHAPPPVPMDEDADSTERGGSEQSVVRRAREWIVEQRFEGRAEGDADASQLFAAYFVRCSDFSLAQPSTEETLHSPTGS